MFKRFKEYNSESGQSLLEVLIAMSVFALIASSVAFLIVDSYNVQQQSVDLDRAYNLAEDALEIIKMIKEDNWSEILENSDGTVHGIIYDSGEYKISNEADIVGRFTRTINIYDVYRDNQGKGIIVSPDNSEASFDVHTKEVVVTITWVQPRDSEIVLSEYISNWESLDWKQTDWSGGDAQNIWEDETKYLSDNGNLDLSTLGELKLKRLSGGAACTGNVWSFDTASNYTFNSEKIEVQGGKAQLLYGTFNKVLSLKDSSFDKEDAWDSNSWNLGNKETSVNIRQSEGGNPGWWAETILEGRKDTMVGGYWEQEIVVGEDNPDSAFLSLDYIISQLNLQSSDKAEMFIFIENSSGEPADISNAIWSYEVSSGETLNSWQTVQDLDISGEVNVTGSYFFKAALLLTVSKSSNNDWKTFAGGYDNINLRWEKISSGYPSDNPAIKPVSPYQAEQVDIWTYFSEEAVKNGGEVYYQLSDDNGENWYYWSGNEWVGAGSSDYNTADQINSNIWEFPVSRNSMNFRAFLSSNGDNQIELDEVRIGCGNIRLEAGKVNADEAWQTINFQNQYDNPIIVASVLENDNTIPVSVRMHNLTQTSVDIRLQNPGDSDLVEDEISYLIVEEGQWNINGMKVEATNYETNTVGSIGNWNYDEQNFKFSFDDPVVLHQVQSSNDERWITTYVSSLDSRSDPPDGDGMRIGLNGASAFDVHGIETVGWIIMENGTNSEIDGVILEVQRTDDIVRGLDNSCYQFDYQNTFSDNPLTIASQQEIDGNEGGWAVKCSETSTQVGLAIEEDQITGLESKHTTETLAFISFSESFAYSPSGNGTAFATLGSLISSSFNTQKETRFNLIEWVEEIPECSGNCSIELQLRTAEDNAGTPVNWTEWFGAEGLGSNYSESSGQIIPIEYINQWVQYKVIITGDGTQTPVLKDITINYND